MEISWTFELAYSSSPPIGAKMTPTPNRSGRTVLGVRMGCHAFRRCWRKAVSVLHHQRCHFQAHCAGSRLADVLGGLLLFCFLSGSSFSRKLLESVCSMVCDMFWCEDCTPVGGPRGGGRTLSVGRSSCLSQAFVSGGREAALLSQGLSL